MKKSFLLTIVVALALIASCATTGGGSAAADTGKPPASPTTVIKLGAKDAQLVTTGQLQYEESDVRNNIGWWGKTDDQIKWNLEVKEAGTYWVIARLSCDPQFPGSTVNVTINGKVMEFKVPDTGSWIDYVDVVAGSVELKPGAYPVLVQAKVVANRFVCNLGYLVVEK
jgi:hypothetical protein